MKKILLILLLTCQYFVAFGYELRQKTNFGNSLTYYQISDNDKEIAQFYLLDPEDNFHFFSIDQDPKLFNNLSAGIDTVSKLINIKPSYAIIADFSKKIEFEKKFNLTYIWNSIGVMIFAPSYLKKANILNPNNTSKRFFIELEINGKEFYSVVIFNKAVDIKNVKKIITSTKDLNVKKIKLYSLLDFPLALMTFGKNDTIVYESNKNIKKYSCLFLTGK